MNSYLSYHGHSLHFSGQLLDVSAFQSPCFLFSRNRLSDNLRSVKSAASAFSIYYALKSCYHKSAVNVIRDFPGFFFEVMTGRELDILTNAGISFADVVFNGIGRGDSLNKAVYPGVKAVVADNPFELQQINSICEKAGRKQDVFLRFYPFFECFYTPRTFIPRNYKLGIQSREELEVMLAIIRKSRFISLSGLSFHIAARAVTPDLHLQAMQQILSVYTALNSEFTELRTVSAGGGFESRFLMERQISLSDFFCPLNQLAEKSGVSEFIIEPGRLLINDAFIALSTVTSVKKSADHIWYILDFGTNALIPRQNSYYEVFPLNWNSGSLFNCSFADGICSASSVISKNQYLPELSCGDQVIIANCGAYTWNLASGFGYDIPPVHELK